MGLDMYFNARNPDVPETDITQELHYWRKHNALHGWFCDEAIRQGLVTSPEEFNTVSVTLTPELLDRLEEAINKGELKPTNGFFFGSTDYNPVENRSDDLKALAKARLALKKGKEPYYTSWW
tara:strand:- start:229 stop:594 length:366 start_codon:yes stop_codon:yes gene_type:complete